MTAQSLYDTLTFFSGLDENLGLQSSLDSILASLTSLVSSPAEPTLQKTLADSLASFEEGARELRDSVSPSRLAAIAEMGGGEFFVIDIAFEVKQAIQTNAMTPSVARDMVKSLSARRSAFLTVMRKTADGLSQLGIRTEKLPAGYAEISFLIPRSLFDDSLADFAKELTFISRLIQDVNEGITGEVRPVKLETLSSSVPTITLDAGIEAIKLIATVVAAFLATWDRIEKIRKTRQELLDLGLKGKAVEELEEKIEETVDEIVEESTMKVIANYADGGRKNELSNAIRQGIRRLFGQIERGLTVEFRTAESDRSQDGSADSIDEIRNLGSTMRFPNATQAPLLLGASQVLEGEIHVISKTKKTHKTISRTRKESGKEKP